MSENTLERPGEFDALEKARPDELIFPLLERDPDAPPVIRFWVDRRRKRALAEIEDMDALKAELMQCTEAEFIAFEMERRRKGEAVEVAATRASYSGEAVARPATDDLMTKLRSRVAEADYEANEALNLIAEIVAVDPELITPTLRQNLDQAQATIHRIALTLSPYRAQYLAEGELPLPESG